MFALDWTQPSSGAVSYKVEWSTDSGSNWSVLVDNLVPTGYDHISNLLTPGATFQYRVISKDADNNESQPSAVVSGTAVAQSSTNLLTNVSATKITATSIAVSAVPPAGALINAITPIFTNDDGNTWQILTLIVHLGDAGWSHIFSGLTSGVCYGYRFRLDNDHFSDEAYASTGTVSAPSAPSGLTATADGATTINLAWTAPTTNKCGTITGYKIEVSTDGGSTFSDLVASHGMTTYSHTGLSAGDTRHYRVSAINSGGTGAVSSVANATTEGTVATIPGAPTSLTATASGQTTINLSWTAPSDGGAAISSYRILVSTDGTSFTELVASHTSTSYSDTGLSPNTTRYYSVSALNSVGRGPESSVANATTAAGVPSAPTGFGVFPDDYHQMVLEWNAPTSNGGATVTGYHIEWSTDGSVWSTLVDNTNTTTGEYIHISSRLTPGDDFYYRVRAINSVGRGSWSTEESDTAIDAEGIGIATSLTASITSTGHISVSWSAPTDIPSAGDITAYTIYKSDDNGDSWEQIGSQSATPTTYTDMGPFTIGSSYGYRVITGYRDDRNMPQVSLSDLSDEVYITFSTVPGAPTGLSATANGPTTINLSWTAPTSNGGATISGYRIDVSTDGGTNFSQLVASHSTTSYSHTGLTAGTAHHYRVRAINSVGSSGWSNTANATTAAATAPGAPTSLTATASGQTIINLSWTAPTSNGGATISGYRIEVSTDGGTNFSQLVASQSGTSYSHTGLTAGTARHYRVRAINSVGSSGWSNTANATTAAATVPGAPTSLTATASGQTIINLSWTAPTSNGGATISGYRIDVSTDGGTNFSQLVASQSGTSYSHTGLTAGTARHYRVRAINSVGSSGWSNTANATTAAVTAPGAPTSLTAVADGQTTIDLSWTAPTSDGGAAISGYRIEVSTNGGSSFSQLVASQSGTSYSHTGLTAGTARHYRVRAINSVGSSG